jgi:hypothetical protein
MDEDPLFEDIKEITDELLIEFKSFGKEYPLLTKMFMDLVSIVAQQNEQISKLSESVEMLANGITKKEVIIKEHEWKLDLLKTRLLESSEFSQEELDFSPFPIEKKKILLN